MIKLEKEVNLSLKNVRIEEYCKDDEANETYGGINVDAIQGDYITYSFDTEPDVQCVAEYLHDMITSVKTPDKLGIQSQLFLNGNGKGDNSDSHHVIATVQGSKDSVLYLRESLHKNPWNKKIINEKITSSPEERKSLNL